MNLTSPTKAVVRREVLVTLKRWRSLFFVLGWMAASLFVTYTFWPDSTGNIQLMRLASLQLVAVLTLVVFISVSMTVPALAAVSLASERDEDTYDLLRLTLLSDRALIRAKVLSSVVLAILYLVAVAPVMSVAQFLVGLDNTQIVQLLFYLLLYILMCACMGVACSAIFRRTFVAIAFAYAILTFSVLSPIFSAAYRILFWNYRGSGVPSRLRLAPASVLMEILAQGMRWTEYAIGCLPLCAAGLLFLWAARVFLRKTRQPRALRNEKLIDDKTVLQERRKHFPYYLIDPLRRKPPIPDERNPMIYREIRWGLFNKTTSMVRTFYVTFIVFFFYVAAASMSTTDDDLIVALCVQMFILIAAAPVLTGNAWTREREMGNIDMLRMTLLRPTDLYVGKAAGGISALLPVVLAMFTAFLPAYIFHHNSIHRIAAGQFTLLHCALVALSLCLYASFYARRTTGAIVGGGLLCGLAYAGVYFILMLGLELERFDSAAELAACSSPVFAFFNFMTNKTYTLQAHRGVHAWLASLAIFTALGAAGAMSAIARLRHREARDK